MTSVDETPFPRAVGRAAAVRSRRMVDAPTRALHWLLAGCFAGAYASAEGDEWRAVHITLGYTVAGLLAARLAWGLVGPRPARLSSLAARLRAAAGSSWWLALCIVSLLVGLAATAATGYIQYAGLAGEWMEDVHEFAGNLMLAGAVGHVALVAVVSLLRGRNLAATMLTGRAPGPGPDLVQRNRGGLAAALVVAVSGFWAWQWQHPPPPPERHERTEHAEARRGEQLPAAARGHHDDDED